MVGGRRYKINYVAKKKKIKIPVFQLIPRITLLLWLREIRKASEATWGRQIGQERIKSLIAYVLPNASGAMKGFLPYPQRHGTDGALGFGLCPLCTT